ncbi:hypothetical protein E1162_08630 [Rhodobacteraceae bacterium RKSG542]|uniref:hypothetical protein n=1 Tax=Pseudovibrio flavus TaxID=2529854 RepID=UPI0012BBDF4C|nr:hypothetical protein [Pseudovibrio flavus]MTI17307.1 hypothetical protein [Pseudovibrio flavus]
MRRTRAEKDFDQKALLEHLGLVRRHLVKARATRNPRSGLARSLDGVIAEIDELALVMTGERDYFFSRGFSGQMRGAAEGS